MLHGVREKRTIYVKARYGKGAEVFKWKNYVKNKE